MTGALFDPGLQPERTALSWRRTGLSMAVGSLAAVRVLPELVGSWGYAVGGAAFVVAVGILIASHYRYRRDHVTLTASETDRVALSGGALIGITALAVLAAGLGALALLVFLALR